ncbi:MAG: energy transducer TonB [Betaproteobacteria bacterium]|nr:energy transducer TonB [Betaproteobacteria bacterium]
MTIQYRWVRISVHWLSVGLVHAAVLGAALRASPPLPPIIPKVIQASLIPPQPLVDLSGLHAQPSPEERPTAPPPPPKKSKPPKKTPHKPTQRRPAPEAPKPLLAAEPVNEAAPAPSYEVAQSSADLPQSDPAAAGLGSAEASTPAGGSTNGTLTAPIFNADYLENPRPAYPQLSRRRGETGRVLLRVYVSASGRAERIEINKSSGFERLDSAARDAVLGWRFVPARRGSEHVAAWVLIPISFVM